MEMFFYTITFLDLNFSEGTGASKELLMSLLSLHSTWHAQR